MSSINTLANTGYYQLNGGSANTNVTQSLITALAGNSPGASPGNDDAYLLSLSPSAQQYLKTGSLPAVAGQQGFTLNSKQQQAITDILTKYKDAPYTQDTFVKIQNDLNAAGLGASTLTMEDKAKSFNAAQVLINALSGGNADSSNSGVASDSDEQAKANSYIQNIIGQWKNMSGNSASVTAAGAGGGA